jgi:competence protein ComEA
MSILNSKILKTTAKVLAIFAATSSLAFALDVNTATQTDLDAIKGIGPVKAKAIIDERAKNGNFKDAKDLATRVKGIGDKSVVNLQSYGLTVGAAAGAAMPVSNMPSNAAPVVAVKKNDVKVAEPAKTANAIDETKVKEKAAKEEKAAAKLKAKEEKAAAKMAKDAEKAKLSDKIIVSKPANASAPAAITKELATKDAKSKDAKKSDALIANIAAQSAAAKKSSTTEAKQ